MEFHIKVFHDRINEFGKEENSAEFKDTGKEVQLYVRCKV
jgi:hypothetical protein